MASNLKYAVTTKNAKLDAITTAIGNAGILKIYAGSQPANPDAGDGGATVLATLTCGSPFAAGAASGVLTASAITQDSSADGTGTAAWFRITTSGGTAKVDGTVGTSGTDLILDSVSITATQVVSVTSLTITSAN
jgi:hypothetical protein